jgi:hypothetical protein
MINRRRIFAGALVYGLAAFGVFGQVSIEPRARPASNEPSIPTASLRVDTNLVLVPVIVDDQLNRPVTGLEKENFRLYDDKMEEVITAFSTEDEPIALGLVLP